MHHGVTFNFGTAKVFFSPDIFETSFSYDKDIWIAVTTLSHNCAISIDSYSLVNKFYSSIIFSLLINAVILQLNCLVLLLYLYMHFLSLRCYFLFLNIIHTFI